MFVMVKVFCFRENVKYDFCFKSFIVKLIVFGKVYVCGYEWLLLFIM